jgi:hypothetical protein
VLALHPHCPIKEAILCLSVPSFESRQARFSPVVGFVLVVGRGAIDKDDEILRGRPDEAVLNPVVD